MVLVHLLADTRRAFRGHYGDTVTYSCVLRGHLRVRVHCRSHSCAVSIASLATVKTSYSSEIVELWSVDGLHPLSTTACVGTLPAVLHSGTLTGFGQRLVDVQKDCTEAFWRNLYEAMGRWR